VIYKEDEFLHLSGLQHFAFCRRQWALIHIEQQWEENIRTTEGQLIHSKAHDADIRESRGDKVISRGVSVYSSELGVSGQCDVLEYHRGATGVPLPGRDGLWQPYPIEYKRGEPKENDADALQLCTQAMCLEQMLCCDIPEGALYYGQTHRRVSVEFDAQLRARVHELLAEMHALYRRGHSPKAKPAKHCNACSLKELCLPRLSKKLSVSDYLKSAMGDMP